MAWSSSSVSSRFPQTSRRRAADSVGVVVRTAGPLPARAVVTEVEVGLRCVQPYSRSQEPHPYTPLLTMFVTASKSFSLPLSKPDPLSPNSKLFSSFSMSSKRVSTRTGSLPHRPCCVHLHRACPIQVTESLQLVAVALLPLPLQEPLREKGRERKQTPQAAAWIHSEVPGPTRIPPHSKQ